jgi:hypothetical protein
MPKTRVCRLAQRLAQAKGWKLPLDGELAPSVYLAEHVVIAFHVSREAAMVRLRQLGFIV